MVNEDLKVNPTSKKYIITFKRKDLRHNKVDDKVEILKKIARLGDFENYVNISDLRVGDKFHRYNKKGKTMRNENDRFNPIVPNTETVHDINRYEFPVVMMKLTEQQYHLVRKDPNVLMVEEDSAVFMHMSTAATPQQIPYGITRLKAPEAWLSSNKRGAGVQVGVIDSGIEYTHPDLSDQYWQGATFMPGTDSPIDEGSPLDNTGTLYWHGTHVAGTIAAIDNQEGVVGVAPLAKLFSIRVFGPNELGTTHSVVIAGMEWAIQNGMDITNNSYGGPASFNTTIQTQWQQAYEQFGMILCASSGNDGNKNMNPAVQTSGQNYPCGYPAAIEVGAINETDTVPTFGNYGTKTEFAAPGNQILSTYTMSQFGGYTKLNGTSMSCPHVTGMFAMGLSAWRFSPCSDMYHLSTKKNEVLRTIARQTADKLGRFADRDPTNALGYGIPNVNAFAKKLLNPDIHIQTVA